MLVATNDQKPYLPKEQNNLQSSATAREARTVNTKHCALNTQAISVEMEHIHLTGETEHQYSRDKQIYPISQDYKPRSSHR